MKKWKDEKILEWLLEDDNPSVKYFTLIELLEKKFDDSVVEEAKSK